MSLCHQVSLRLSDKHKQAIRSKLAELKQSSQDPDSVTEADAHRALLEDAARVTKQEAPAR